MSSGRLIKAIDNDDDQHGTKRKIQRFESIHY